VKRRDFLLSAAALAGAPTLPQSAANRPANALRSVQRLFTSEAEDKPWFHDREMWPHYVLGRTRHGDNRRRRGAIRNGGVRRAIFR